jgi:hypothetical protein
MIEPSSAVRFGRGGTGLGHHSYHLHKHDVWHWLSYAWDQVLKAQHQTGSFGNRPWMIIFRRWTKTLFHSSAPHCIALARALLIDISFQLFLIYSLQFAPASLG